MIAKKLDDPIKDSYTKLAEYAANASEKGEKLEDFWIVNSPAGETLNDLELAILDINTTQEKNTRAKSFKSYHIVVSFREDDEQPSLEALKDMELELAKALGFEEHQRVVGTHSNTGNFHMHVAYSKIHPKTFNMHTPFQAYPKMSEVCREMEKKYNLKIDNGYEKTKEKDYERSNPKAKSFESNTWQQSFHSYVKERKEPLKDALKQSKDWQGFHKGLAEQGLLIKKRGNGAVITSKDGKQVLKASEFDRSFSKGKLEKRFGEWEEEINLEAIEPKTEYTKKPLTKHKNTNALWKKYENDKKEYERQLRERKRNKTKKKKAPKLKRPKYNWKDFLMYEALKDPMAMAIIIMQRKLINSIFLTTDKKKPAYVKSNTLRSNELINSNPLTTIKKQPVYVKNNVFRSSNPPDNKKMSPEDYKQRDERIKEILKQGINSAEDKKLLKEESKRLIASIKYFEENGKKGDWAELKKDKIDEMLKECSLFPEESKQDSLKNKPDSKKLSPEDYKQRNKQIKNILNHEISSIEDEKLLKEESKRLAANLQRSKEEGKKGHWANLKKNRIDRMLKEYSFTPEELKQDILKKMTEGKVVSVPKEIADELGAFIETAVSFDDIKPEKKAPKQEEELKQAAEKVAKELDRG